MSIAIINFLQEYQPLPIKKWISYLPKKFQEKYRYEKLPYFMEEEQNIIKATLSIQKEDFIFSAWEHHLKALYVDLRKSGVRVLLPNIITETFPLSPALLPTVYGQRLKALYAFRAVKRALSYKGKSLEESKVVIVGGEGILFYFLLVGMSIELNTLSFYHQNPDQLQSIQEELFYERGLQTEVIGSPNNPALAQADVLILCEQTTIPWDHIIHQDGIILDIYQNTSLLRKIAQKKKDVLCMEEMQFGLQDMVLSSVMAEAVLYDEYVGLQKPLIQSIEEKEEGMRLGRDIMEFLEDKIELL